MADPFWATPRGRFDSFDNQDKPEIFGFGLDDIVNYLKKMMEQGFRVPYCLGRIGRLAFDIYWEEHRAHPALYYDLDLERIIKESKSSPAEVSI